MNKPDWSEVYFTADVLGEKFSNTQLITLKQHYYDEVDKYYFHGEGFFKHVTLKDACDSGDIKVREFIKHESGKPLTICLDVERADDDAVFHALDQLWLVLQEHPNFLQLDQATLFTGESKTFKYKDLHWLVRH